MVENERLCQLCNLNAVESEVQVPMPCYQYAILRQPLLDRDCTVYLSSNSFNDADKLCFVLTDHTMCRISAKTFFNILYSRTFYCVNKVFVILSNYQRQMSISSFTV